MRTAIALLACASVLGGCKDETASPPPPTEKEPARDDACTVLEHIAAAIKKAETGTPTPVEEIEALHRKVDSLNPSPTDPAGISAARYAFSVGLAFDAVPTCESLRAVVAKADGDVAGAGAPRGTSAVAGAATAGFLRQHVIHLAAKSAIAGYSPSDRQLITAIEEGAVDSAMIALREGATGNVKLLDGRSAGAAAVDLDRELVLTLAKHKGFDPNLETTGEPVLHRVLRAEWKAGEVAEAARALLAAGASTDSKGELGATPLMLACLLDRVVVAKALIAAGANVNATDDLGRSVSTYANRALKPAPLVRLLSSKGATRPAAAVPSPKFGAATPTAHPELPDAISEKLATPNGESVRDFHAANGTAVYRVSPRTWRAFQTARGAESAVSLRVPRTGARYPACDSSLIALSLDDGRIAIFEGDDGLWRRTAVVHIPDSKPDSLRPLIVNGTIYVPHGRRSDVARSGEPQRLSILAKRGRRWKLGKTIDLPADGTLIDIAGDSFVFREAAEDKPASVVIRELRAKSWVETARFRATRPGYTGYGKQVFVSPDRVVIGAGGLHHGIEDGDSFGHGAIFVYDKKGASWERSATLYGNTKHDRLDLAAVVGDRIYGGAGGTRQAGDATGSVYVYELQDGEWKQIAQLSLAHAKAYDNFALRSQFDGRWLWLSQSRDREDQWFRLEVAP